MTDGQRQALERLPQIAVATAGLADAERTINSLWGACTAGAPRRSVVFAAASA